MGRRKAYLHIGLPRSGGAFIDSALAEHAGALEDRGIRHPAISAEEMLRAAIEIQRDHKAWGYQRRQVEGAWAEICRRANRGKGSVVFSQELLAACTPAQIDLLLDSLSGFEVHVVVTARDLGSQLVATWADSVVAGRPVSFAKFRKRVMDPTREHDQAQRFWADQDLGTVLGRWAAAVRRSERLHVVVPSEDDPDPHQTTWLALGEIVGFDAARLPLEIGVPTDSLATGIAVLSSVNLAALPPDLHGELLEVGERWRKELAEGGYDVHGDTTALLPGPIDPDATLPDDVPLDDRLSMTADALADALVDVAQLREQNAALHKRNAKLEKKGKKLRRRMADPG